MAKRVAVLGLGTMGSGMAASLLKAGYDVTVYNRTPAKAEPLKSSMGTTKQDAKQRFIRNLPR